MRLPLDLPPSKAAATPPTTAIHACHRQICINRSVYASVAFASPPVQDEKTPDQVIKVSLVEKEPTAELTEEEADPLIEDEAGADSHMVEPDSVLLEPETTEEQRVPEDTQVMLEEPVLEANYLSEEKPETEQELEPEITAIQTNRNNMAVEEAVPELESETNRTNENETNTEIQMEPGRGSRRANTGRWACRGVILQGKCYQFFRINFDAYHAEFHCQSICHRGHLASVTSSYILGEFGKLMDQNGGRTRAWLGGRRIVGTNTFIWSDGTWWNYYGWARGEPNNINGRENCVEMWHNLVFNDEACTTRIPFICSCPL
ncbi:C-type lectin [Labeo rohita]|uniref:C-type lectin n=1 Tax=Labeo rohita TaxID=84645 RepID=A0ABQ8MDT6_LABRO|nr:C-type lectin [Labeo rohita]